MKHFMIDIETTGTDPKHTSMIQLAAVNFDLETGAVNPDMFCSSLTELPGRYWEKGTEAFWRKMPDLLKKIQREARPPREAMMAFFQWVNKHGSGDEKFFWAKPSTFDWVFVDEYFTQTEILNPFNFRGVVDMRSWIKGKLGTMSLSEITDLEKSIEFQGIEHDARFDALHQVRVLFKATGVKL